MRFEKYDISPEIKSNLEELGFHRATDIQYKAIPAILNDEDVLAIAQTGTGKTAAFAIPIIDKIQYLKANKKTAGIHCLVLAPTRELAQQIGKVFSKISKRTKANSYAVYGGVDQDPQIKQLAGGVDILIATPGRMFDLIHQKAIDVSKVKTLVLDEADHMLDLGFIKDIESIKRKLTQRHQTLFFSATINKKIKKLAYSQIRSNALRIQIAPENRVSKNVSHFVAKVSMDDKRHLLVNILKDQPDTKCILFTRTQVRVERVAKHLAKAGFTPLSLHGGMDQNEREKNLEQFREQSGGVLIATDVTARGIDLKGINLVINYDLPEDPEYYVHRVGRTGRAFDYGEALSFCSPEEADKLKVIEEFIQAKIEVADVHESALIDKSAAPPKKTNFAELIEQEEEMYKQKQQKKKKSKKKR
ncbi:MAG: DEAD/DEAH box helicase [Bdellovibrionales bacterium]|nr:DEAD/DEAH box helicase [Bdellovibrionales bacterium]